MIISSSLKDIYEPIPMKMAIRGIILNALAFTNGHQRRAARLLGLSDRMMNHHMQKYHIPRALDGLEGR